MPRPRQFPAISARTVISTPQHLPTIHVRDSISMGDISRAAAKHLVDKLPGLGRPFAHIGEMVLDLRYFFLQLTEIG